MAASSLSLIFSTKLGQEIGIRSNMGRKDNRTPQGCVNTSKDAEMGVPIDAKQWDCGSNHHL